MAGFVQGRNCLFKVDVLGSFLPLICAKSFTATVTTDTVETSTQGTGQFKSYDYDALSWTLNFDGIQKIVDAAVNPTFYDMLSAQLSFLPVGFKMLFIDPDGITKELAGTVLITSTGLTASISEPAGGTLELQGTGEFAVNNPSSSCDILMTSFDISNGIDNATVTPPGVTLVPFNGPYTITPNYTNGPAVRFDYQIDGGGYNTTFASSWSMDISAGVHTIDIIPYCEGNISPGTFTAQINSGAPD